MSLREKTIKFYKSVLENVDSSVMFLAFATSLMVAYYINPLINVELTDWNRTFSPAILAGISINKRIFNFYKLFFLFIPSLLILFGIGYSLLFKFRRGYKEYFKTIIIIELFPTFASYISRYAQGSNEISHNSLIFNLIVFLLLMTLIALLDKEVSFSFSDITFYFVTFLVVFLCTNLLIVTGDSVVHSILSAIATFICAVLNLKFSKLDVVKIFLHNCICVLLWLPAIIRVALEGIYFLNEKGWTIQRYNTNINKAVFLYIISTAIISWVLFKRKIAIKNAGYVGAIVSITSIGYFAYSYQYTWSYGSMANVYELGNASVAMDSVVHGKLPIIDYFSAHALSDVWTRILYSFIHNDWKGILVNPYGGLVTVFSCLILFYIVKELFDEDIAVLIVLLFPGMVSGIRWVSLCTVSILSLIYAYKKPRYLSFIVYWFAVLFGSFVTYDEGISLGIATIAAYVVIETIRKKWVNLKRFIISGAGVGGSVLLFYIVYASIRGFGIVSRIKEWLSVSVGSSSSWATVAFGEQSSFAFLVSYFIVPFTAISLLIFALIKYIKTKNNGLVTLLTITFAFTEILYITRGIVFHNLAVCSGKTGVLLNFVHWTVSMFVLLKLSESENKNQNKLLLGWAGAMMAVIILEGTAVTSYWPGTNSCVASQAIVCSEAWELKDDTTDNLGKDRIIYDDASSVFVNQFSTIFNTLLKDEETFIDFANVTSMYLLTGRERPCYVGQSPSLLTDLFSQEMYLEEVGQYNCPLAVLGTTGTSYISQMQGVPHNLRYYKIAEYIYLNYRPLVCFNEFVIWCEKSLYDEYYSRLEELDLNGLGYSLVDYGYDFTILVTDESGNQVWDFKPYHSYNLQDIPYIWANYDDYKAKECSELLSIEMENDNNFKFAGSQSVVNENGNYLLFECTNLTEENISINVVLYDSHNDGAKYEYYFNIKPGTNTYMIRASQDYFWDVFNIDTILFEKNESVVIQNVHVLEGD